MLEPVVIPQPGDFGIGRLFSALRDAVVIADVATSHIVLWNPGAESLFGYDALEVVGHSLERLLPEEAREQFREALRGPYEAGDGTSMLGSAPRELSGLHKDGRAVIVEATFTPVEAADVVSFPGTYVMALMRDVTERRQVERELATSEERFRLAFEEAPIGMAIVDTDFRLARVNRALCAMLSYEESDLAGRDFRTVTHPDDVESDARLAERVFKGELPSYQLEKRFIAQGGREIPARLTAAAIRSADGTPRSGLGIIEDLTAERELAAQRADDARLQGAMMVARTVAHEINNAISPVTGFSELLATRPSIADDPQAAMFVKLIGDAAEQVAQCVRKLQHIVRVEGRPGLPGAGGPLLDLEASAARD